MICLTFIISFKDRRRRINRGGSQHLNQILTIDLFFVLQPERVWGISNHATNASLVLSSSVLGPGSTPSSSQHTHTLTYTPTHTHRPAVGILLRFWTGTNWYSCKWYSKSLGSQVAFSFSLFVLTLFPRPPWQPTHKNHVRCSAYFFKLVLRQSFSKILKQHKWNLSLISDFVFFFSNKTSSL